MRFDHPTVIAYAAEYEEVEIHDFSLYQLDVLVPVASASQATTAKDHVALEVLERDELQVLLYVSSYFLRHMMRVESVIYPCYLRLVPKGSSDIDVKISLLVRTSYGDVLCLVYFSSNCDFNFVPYDRQFGLVLAVVSTFAFRRKAILVKFLAVDYWSLRRRNKC